MEVYVIVGSQVRDCAPGDLPAVLAAGEGVVWVDVPVWDDEAAAVLAAAFTLHPLALRDCEVRNRVPKVHAYADHLFVVVHAPERGPAGHVHYMELDQFIGPGYLVTVHGPVNPAVPLSAALRDTEAVRSRIRSGRLAPATSFELSHAIISSLTRRMEHFVETLTEDVWGLEQRVMAGHLGNPERFLDQMFRARHGIITVRTMAAQAHEIYTRIVTLSRYVPADARPLVADVVDQFDRIRNLSEQEKDYLQGVIDFYRTRTDTKMTIAAERLAVIAVVTLPVTALASVFGMNMIVNDHTTPVPLVVVLVVMTVMSGLLLVWAKRRGWW
jgi:magnesium transporter